MNKEGEMRHDLCICHFGRHAAAVDQEVIGQCLTAGAKNRGNALQPGLVEDDLDTLKALLDAANVVARSEKLRAGKKRETHTYKYQESAGHTPLLSKMPMQYEQY